MLARIALLSFLACGSPSQELPILSGPEIKPPSPASLERVFAGEGIAKPSAGPKNRRVDPAQKTALQELLDLDEPAQDGFLGDAGLPRELGEDSERFAGDEVAGSDFQPPWAGRNAASGDIQVDPIE